jgi:hypothetical protein
MKDLYLLRYVHEYTPLGRIVTGLLMLVWLSEILLLCTYKKKKQA